MKEVFCKDLPKAMRTVYINKHWLYANMSSGQAHWDVPWGSLTHDSFTN